MSAPAQMERIYRLGAGYERMMEEGMKRGNMQAATIRRYAQDILEHYCEKATKAKTASSAPRYKF